MKKHITVVLFLFALGCFGIECKKQGTNLPPNPPGDSSLVNTLHLDYLYIPVDFATGTHAAGVYIYANAPDYHYVEASGEGYTCVDDVSRAALVYLRSKKFNTDTATQSKAYHLIRFILEMQSANGYFYNFLFSNGLINTSGVTSIDNPNWWSWRALQTLSEGAPLIKSKDASLYGKMELAITKLVEKIKVDLVNLPTTTKWVNGITVPQWLPNGSGADQSAIMIQGLISYCSQTSDTVIKNYIKKLADGMSLMQQGNSTLYPYSCFLSWENQWHAYGNDQANALFQAAAFLGDAQYSAKALAEVDNFYPWLLLNGYKSSFSLSKSGNVYQPLNEKSYEQIAYGIRPMVFAAIEAYKLTGKQQYADIAGHLAAWFFGANVTATNIYDVKTGRCYDAIFSATGVNNNSGAESTIEALLTLQRVENYPAVKTALNKYKK